MPSHSIPFLYRDDHWLVVNKPTGLSSHAANAGDLGIAEWFLLHHDLKIHICSRLDKGTSGVLLVALNAAASARAQKIHTQNQSKKIYSFVSDKKYLKGTKWLCAHKLDQADCETAFELIKEGSGYYLYKAEITRGRKHQIRRHAAASGVAILGDDEYGGAEFPRLCLHCHEVLWPEISQRLCVALPSSFEHLLEGKDSLTIETAVAMERRMSWLKSVSTAFRVVHRGEVMRLPFAIDIFDAWLCVTGFDETISSQTLKEKLTPTLNTLSQYYGLKGGVVKTNRQDPHRNRLFTDLASFGESPPDSFLVHEQGLVYEVALNDNQHVGLFLDQRDTRRRLSLVAKGKRVANLFAFTCSFSAVAVKAGAEVVFSVDLAAGALDRGKTNFTHNELTGLNRGKFITEDVRTWLARQLRNLKSTPDTFQPWDVIICDPPVFASTGRGHSFSVFKMWPELAKNIRAILAKDGVALFANNHRKGDDRYYYHELKNHFSRVTQLRPPFDFPDIKGVPAAVRIYWCQL